jgi:hypothetical protein
LPNLRVHRAGVLDVSPGVHGGRHSGNASRPLGMSVPMMAGMRIMVGSSRIFDMMPRARSRIMMMLLMDVTLVHG